MDGIRGVTEQMNSDMFDHVDRAHYDVSNFSRIELEQAKESFNYNGYKAYDNEGKLSVKKFN